MNIEKGGGWIIVNDLEDNLIFSSSFFFIVFVKISMEKRRFSVKEWKLECDRFFDTLQYRILVHIY